MRRSLVVIGLAGCDAVFGLESISDRVSLTYVKREIRNDTEGLPVTRDVERLPSPPTVIFDDGSVPPVTTHPDRSFTFVRTAVQGYRARFGPDVEYQGSASELHVQDLVIGRADRQDPLSTTVEQTIQAAVPGAGRTAYLVTTGLWTQTPHTEGTGDNTRFVFPWPEAQIPGRFLDSVGIVKSAEYDRAFAVTRISVMGQSATYARLTDACEDPAPFELGSLGNATLACTASTVQLERCAQVHAPHTATLAQLDGVVDAVVYTRQRYLWSINAVPSPAFHPQFGLTLAQKEIEQPAGLPVVDWNEPVDFGNPYPGHAVGVRTHAYRERTVMAPNATTVASLFAVTDYWRAAEAACNDADPPPTVAIATTPTLSGAPLVQDALHLTHDRAQLAVLEWTITAGNADFYQVTLHEVAKLFNGTFIAARQTYVTESNRIAVDPALFQVGRLYVFSIATHAGYPRAAAGDFVTLDYPAGPLAISVNWSSTFTVE